MSLVRAYDDPDLSGTEVLVCVHCGSITDGERCHECGGGGAVAHDVAARGRKAMSARWGEDVAACGFTSTPNVLLEHLPALGLEAVDLVLLELLEKFRRGGPGHLVRPGVDHLAERIGLGERQTRRRLDELVRRGLIEREARPGERGRWPHNEYTRHGLTAALTLIAANRRAGLKGEAELEGLAALLDELPPDPEDRRSPTTAGHTRPRPAVMGDRDRRSPMSDEEEAVEEDAIEEDSRDRAPIALSRDGGRIDFDDDIPF